MRLASLAEFPLIDRTESRYAEIARTIVADGNWVTPHLHGEPFWGKPPLATWASALGIVGFGVNEFGVRFPAWLAIVLMTWIVWRTACLWLPRRAAYLAPVIFTVAPVSIGMAGGAMTDPYLGLGLAISLYALVRLVCEGAATWAIAAWFAVGLAIGTLAKGPIALVLGGAPLAALLATRAGRAHFVRFPWGRASALYLALAVPWFLVAELRTPGFLEYFFVGEHWHRFTTPDWAGDRYGGTHPTPRGMVWLFFAIGFAPWIPGVWLARRAAPDGGKSDVVRLVLWASLLAPLLLFTLAGSVLLPYVFPSVAAASLLLARTACPVGARGAALTTAMCCAIALFALPHVSNDTWARLSQRPLVGNLDCDHVVYCRDAIDQHYSAYFYSGGRSINIHAMSPATWTAVRQTPARYYFVTKRRELYGVPEDLKAHLLIERAAGHYQLWRLPSSTRLVSAPSD